MKLLVIYKVHIYDELYEEHSFEENKIIINAPDDLLQSQYREYVIKNYDDIIFDLEKDCGHPDISISDIMLESVEFITELEKK